MIGLFRSLLALLAYGGLTKICLSTFLGGATPVLWLSWPDVRLFGWLGGSRSSGPLLLASWCFGALSWGSLATFDGASARDIDRVLGGFFDGPEGHAVLLLHPA